MGIKARIVRFVLLFKKRRSQSGQGTPSLRFTAALDVTEHTGNRFTFPLTKHAIVIGKGSLSDLALTDPAVSKRHARIEIKESGYYITDEGSTSGTFVNGKPVSQSVLYTEDVIQVGETHLVLVSSRSYVSVRGRKRQAADVPG